MAEFCRVCGNGYSGLSVCLNCRDDWHKERERLRGELQASDNWLERLLRKVSPMIDDMGVTERAVKKQQRANEAALAEVK